MQIGMRWFVPVPCDNTVENPLVVNSRDLNGFEEMAFYVGKRIQGWNRQAWMGARNRRNNGTPDDVLQNDMGLPIFSKSLMSVLKQNKVAGIQYLPIKVYLHNHEEVGTFFLANILNVISALDTNRADYDIFPEDYFLPTRRGKIRGIQKSVLIGSNLEGFDIIRLKEYLVSIYVSERFKSMFLNSGFTGYSFHEVEVSR